MFFFFLQIVVESCNLLNIVIYNDMCFDMLNTVALNHWLFVKTWFKRIHSSIFIQNLSKMETKNI